MSKLIPKVEETSAYTIDYEAYYQKGFRAVLFDIDNTLVEHGAPANEAAIKLVGHLKEIGYKVAFLSNNKEPRVKSFCDAVGAPYIFKAGKPKTWAYEKMMQQFGVTKKETMSVGDQLFTDMWGANRADILSVLVRPIGKKEEIQIVLKRYLEHIVMFFYHLKKKAKKK